MRSLLSIASVLVLFALVAPVAHAQYAGGVDLTTAGVELTTYSWTPGKSNKNTLSFTIKNGSSATLAVPYRVEVRDMGEDYEDTPVYVKEGKTKKLKPGKSQTVKINLHQKKLVKKFTTGSYNAEVFLQGNFVNSNVFSVVEFSEKTASIKVSTPYDNLYLPPGVDLPIHVDVAGKLPEGGVLDIAIITRTRENIDITWHPGHLVVPKNFTGRMTYTLLYSEATKYKASSYNEGISHFVWAKLLKGQDALKSGLSVRIAEAQTPAWFYTGFSD